MQFLKKLRSLGRRSQLNGNGLQNEFHHYYNGSIQEPISQSIAAAAEQHYENESKLDVALQGVFTDSYQAANVREQNDIRDYTDAKVFKVSPQEIQSRRGSDNAAQRGGVMVCDDYRPDFSTGVKGTRALVVGAVTLALAGLGTAGVISMNSGKEDPSAVVQPAPDKDTDTTITIKPVPGE